LLLHVILPEAVHLAALDTAHEEQMVQTSAQRHQWLSLVLSSGKYTRTFIFKLQIPTVATKRKKKKRK